MTVEDQAIAGLVSKLKKTKDYKKIVHDHDKFELVLSHVLYECLTEKELAELTWSDCAKSKQEKSQELAKNISYSLLTLIKKD